MGNDDDDPDAGGWRRGRRVNNREQRKRSNNNNKCTPQVAISSSPVGRSFSLRRCVCCSLSLFFPSGRPKMTTRRPRSEKDRGELEKQEIADRVSDGQNTAPEGCSKSSKDFQISGNDR